jgi:hypothetical protein
VDHDTAEFVVATIGRWWGRWAVPLPAQPWRGQPRIPLMPSPGSRRSADFPSRGLAGTCADSFVPRIVYRELCSPSTMLLPRLLRHENCMAARVGTRGDRPCRRDHRHIPESVCMTNAEHGPVIHDTGALVADHGMRSMFALHGALLDQARQIIVPAPSLPRPGGTAPGRCAWCGSCGDA